MIDSCVDKIFLFFRVWFAFAALGELGNAMRAVFEEKTFYEMPNSKSPLFFGSYFFLKSLISFHASLYTHYKPLISLAIFSAITTLILALKDINNTLPVVVTIFINGVSLIGLIYSLWYLKKDRKKIKEDETLDMFKKDENFKNLRGNLRRRREN